MVAHDALLGLASVALAQGDEVAARAVLEELVLFLGKRNGTIGRRAGVGSAGVSPRAKAERRIERATCSR